MKQLFTTTLLVCNLLLTTNALIAQTTSDTPTTPLDQNSLQKTADGLLGTQTEVEMVIFLLPADKPSASERSEKEMNQIYLDIRKHDDEKEKTSHNTKPLKMAQLDRADWGAKAMTFAVRGLVNQLTQQLVHSEGDAPLRVSISTVTGLH